MFSYKVASIVYLIMKIHMNTFSLIHITAVLTVSQK